MHVVTWNVLHRVHAENWREEVPDRYPDEADRIARITARVAALLAADADVVVCLQEVSGDQLASLRAALADVDLISQRAPRLPRFKAPPSSLSALQDVSEHLAVLGRGLTRVAGAAFDNDPGKGFVVVESSGVRILDTHLSGGGQRDAQLKVLADIVGDAPFVVCGDCNTSAGVVLAGLGGGFVVADTGPDALPTRPRRDTSGGKPPAIDHILARGHALTDAVVVDVEGMSDHNLVRARVIPTTA